MNIIDLNDHEKAILRKRWGVDGEEAAEKAGRYIIFFPTNKDETHMFGDITLYGQVPSIGDKISFKNMAYKDALPAYNHAHTFYQWYVKDVYWSVNVQTSEKDQLLFDHTVSAQVMVDYYRWTYWWWNFRLKYYYDPKRAIKKWLQKFI